MNLKKNGKVFTSKFVGTGLSSYEKRIYRAAVSQRLRNTALEDPTICTRFCNQLDTDSFPTRSRENPLQIVQLEFVVTAHQVFFFRFDQCAFPLSKTNKRNEMK